MCNCSSTASHSNFLLLAYILFYLHSGTFSAYSVILIMSDLIHSVLLQSICAYFCHRLAIPSYQIIIYRSFFFPPSLQSSIPQGKQQLLQTLLINYVSRKPLPFMSCSFKFFLSEYIPGNFVIIQKVGFNATSVMLPQWSKEGDQTVKS